MELNLKILAPLLQCTSINRCALCAVHESKKKKKKNYSSLPIKKLLNFLSHSMPLSLSLSLSLSLTQLSSSPKTLSISQALIFSQSLSSHRQSPHRPKPPISSPSQATDQRSPHCPKPSIASPSQVADRLTVTHLSVDPAHQPTPFADPTRRHCACLWLVIVDFVWSRLRKKIGDLGFFFFCCGLLMVVVVMVVVVAVVVAVADSRGGCGWFWEYFLCSGIYYFIVMVILFYCDVYIILLCWKLK